MNVGIETVAPQFLSWEYLFRIFGIVSLQCTSKILIKTCAANITVAFITHQYNGAANHLAPL